VKVFFRRQDLRFRGRSRQRIVTQPVLHRFEIASFNVELGLQPIMNPVVEPDIRQGDRKILRYRSRV